jgi:(1->4)-alpha-D-glucan 1-alpha-D-glucosylmutase
MQVSMASELNMLAHALNAISEEHRTCRDFTLGSLTRALGEIVATFPCIARTWARPARRLAIRDRQSHRRAVAQAEASHAPHQSVDLRLDPGHPHAAVSAPGA